MSSLPAPAPGRVARYLTVGGLTFAVYVLILLLFAEVLDQPKGLSAGMAVALGGGANYLLHKYFTFRSDRPHAQAIPRFVTLLVGNIAANSLVTWLASDLAGLPYGAVQAAYLVMATIVMYWLLRDRVMTRRQSAASTPAGADR